jgi:hypothetical protein
MMNTVHLSRLGSSLESEGLRRRSVRLSVGVALGLGVLLAALLLLGASGSQARAGLAPAAVEGAASQSAAARHWLSETVDASNYYIGIYNSLALEPIAPFTPHISYLDWTNSNLKHAWWTSTGWLSETVDDSGAVGWYTSLALEPAAPYTPHISYYDGTNDALKHAWWTPSGWLSETVDNSGSVGEYTSLALEPAAPYAPHISYYDNTNNVLKHAWWTPTGWLSETVDSSGVVGQYTSLALEPAAPYVPHISYYDVSDIALKHAWWTPTGWLSETVDNSGWVGEYTSLALEPAVPYAPHISYYDHTNGALKHAWWTPTGWLSETVDSSGDVGWFTSLALEPAAPYAPHISYHDVSNAALKHAWWTSSGWLSETVDDSETLGWYISLALEPAAPYAPHVSYFDNTSAALKHAWLAPGPPCLAYGWAQNNASGFGDTGNVIVTSLGVHNAQLLAGTLNYSGTQLWRLDGGGWALSADFGTFMSTTVAINHFFSFDGRTYMGTWDETQGGGIWRTLSSTSPTWESIMLDGFGDPGNKEVFRFAEFGGQLYASTWKYDGTGMEIWRSATGDTSSWSQVSVDGFGDLDNQVALSFETFNGYLYAGTYNEATGGEVWRSSNGTVWSQVNDDGFGTADNRGVSALETFGGYLYASTRGGDSPAGAQVWRCQVCDNGDWERVVDDGFGDPDTHGMNGLEVFDGHLYFVVGNAATGLEVRRTADGTTWQQVGSAGFGNGNNLAPYWDNSTVIFGDKLTIGTWNWMDGGEVWQSVCLSYGTYLPLALRDN